jgi:hypothetical protein
MRGSFCNRVGIAKLQRDLRNLKKKHRGTGLRVWEVVDVFLKSRRDSAVAKRFFKRLLRMHLGEPRKIVTDKLGTRAAVSHLVASEHHRDLRVSALEEWGVWRQPPWYQMT